MAKWDFQKSSWSKTQHILSELKYPKLIIWLLTAIKGSTIHQNNLQPGSPVKPWGFLHIRQIAAADSKKKGWKCLQSAYKVPDFKGDNPTHT